MSQVCTGTVKFVHDTGFLFLIPDQTGPEIFGHVTDWEKAGLRAPEKGERYQFEVAMARKGPKAFNPRPAV